MLLRLPIDTIPGHRIFVYRYLSDTFLHLVRKGISIPVRQRILRDTLQAIADLHEKDVVHLGEGIKFFDLDLKLTLTRCQT